MNERAAAFGKTSQPDAARGPPGAPAYDRARPASWWLSAYYRRPGTDPVIGTGPHDPLAVAGRR